MCWVGTGPVDAGAQPMSNGATLEPGTVDQGRRPTDWEATACMANGTDGYAIVKQK